MFYTGGVALRTEYGQQQSHTVNTAEARREEKNLAKQSIQHETHQQRPNTAAVDNLYSKLHELQSNRDRGSIIRSREKTILNNEQPTKYFFTQKHNRQEKKKITNLRINKADVDNDPDNPEYVTKTDRDTKRNT